MATTWSMSVVLDDDGPLPQLKAEAQAALDKVVVQMSQWEANSDLSRFNRAAAGEWVVLPPGLAAVLAEALALSEMTGGAFDPTVGPATELWGFGARQVEAMPEPDAVAAASRSVGWSELTFDAAAARLQQPGGVTLDLCGIAKGFAVDCLAELLTAAGVPAFLVEVGGELRAAGIKPDLHPWWVEVEQVGDLGPAPLRVALSGWAMATSGNTRRFHEVEGVRIGHTIDPRRAAPILNGVEAVTVLAETAMRADGLATALTVMGEAAVAFAAEHDIAARILSRRGSQVTEELSPAFAAMLG